MQLERLDAHRDWANDLLIRWIAEQPEPDDSCLRMLTHILTSEAVWLERFRGETPPKPSGAPLPVEGLTALRRRGAWAGAFRATEGASRR